MQLRLSKLPKTWFIDIDGTIFKHNHYVDRPDEFIPASKRFLDSLPPEDKVILTTARTREQGEFTIRELRRLGIRYDRIVFDCTVGERILINDIKPGGLKCALAVNVPRDNGIRLEVECHE